MNWDRVEGNWKEFKGKVQLQWGKLTNDDLDVIEGKRTELAGRLQQRYGVAKDEAERDIDTWLNERQLAHARTINFPPDGADCAYWIVRNEAQPCFNGQHIPALAQSPPRSAKSSGACAHSRSTWSV